MALELVPKDEVEQTGTTEKAAQEEKPVYTGPERRKQQRRTHNDRREMVRFETKADRRSGKERRRGVGLWKDRDF
jgi:hypothetical protein